MTNSTEETKVNTSSSWVENNFALFEQNLNGGSKLPLHETRKKALSSFKEVGFPTPALEDWKYTDTKSISDSMFSLISNPGKVDSIEKFQTNDLESYKLVFVDGVFAETLSDSKFEDGITVSTLKNAVKNENILSALVNKTIGSIANTEDAFTAINTAFISDGLAIEVKKSKAINKPLEVFFITTSSASNSTINPRIVVVSEESSNVSIIEKYISVDSGIKYFNNSVVEFHVGENAHVDHYRIQDESLNSFHVSNISAVLESNCNFRTHTFSFGSKLARNNVNVVMNGSNCNSTMNGLTVLSDDQHVDNTTLLDHAKPHCESLELYKGIYDKKSKGVFSGTIIVRQDAQKTNAIQSNRSLLLTDEAEVNTKPQLKIWADDVKCTHGATIGQLDDEALFYIRARGVSKKDAQVMLIAAFAGEVTNCIKIDQIKELVENRIAEKLNFSTN